MAMSIINKSFIHKCMILWYQPSFPSVFLLRKARTADIIIGVEETLYFFKNLNDLNNATPFQNSSLAILKCLRNTTTCTNF